MPFDPDKYLSEKISGQGFNPDKYLAEKTGQGQVSPNIPIAQSLGSGIAEGMTGGFTDELGAAGKALMDTATGITNPEDTLQNYRNQRDLLRQEFKKNAEANPTTNLIGNLGGAALAPIGLLKNASPVTQGLVLGGASGLGTSEADLTKGEVGKALTDTAQNAAIGGITSPILNGLLNKLTPEALEDLAERRAVKATGIAKQQYKNLAKNPLLDEEGNAIPGKTQINEIGKRLLDNEVVTPLASGSDILERSKDLSQKSGEDISNIIKTLDQNGPVQTMPDPTKVAKEIQDQLSTPLMNPQGAPYKTMSAQNNVVNNILEDINSHGNTPVSFAEAQAFKQMLKQAAYGSNGQVIDENAHKAYGIVNKWIEDAAHESAQASNEPGLLDQYINAKKNYNTGIQAQNAAFNKEAASAVNRDLGLTDYVSAAAGAAAHGTPGGIVAAAGNKAAKAYGNPLIATGARGLSNIFSMPKEGLQSLATSLNSQGEVGQKLGGVLMEASQRDDIGKNALLFTLMQQSPYRDLLNTSMNGASTASGASNVGQ